MACELLSAEGSRISCIPMVTSGLAGSLPVAKYLKYKNKAVS